LQNCKKYAIDQKYFVPLQPKYETEYDCTKQHTEHQQVPICRLPIGTGGGTHGAHHGKCVGPQDGDKVLQDYFQW
jgi:hypothetical protein